MNFWLALISTNLAVTLALAYWSDTLRRRVEYLEDVERRRVNSHPAGRRRGVR